VFPSLSLPAIQDGPRVLGLFKTLLVQFTCITAADAPLSVLFVALPSSDRCFPLTLSKTATYQYSRLKGRASGGMGDWHKVGFDNDLYGQSFDGHGTGYPYPQRLSFYPLFMFRTSHIHQD
jgi:hypothetical protein